MNQLLLALFFSLFSFSVLKAAEQPPIHLVWQVSKEAMCETDWLREVLSGINYSEIDDGEWSVFKDRSIIVIPRGSKGKKYFKALQEKNYKFVVIHLGDERYSSKPKYYRKMPLVIRNYWHKMYGKNVLTFPLGYMQGFWNHCPSRQTSSTAQRKYTWSFAGQVEKSTRRDMALNMKKIPNFKIHEIGSFRDPNGLAVNLYRELLSDTIFVPCPRGFWNLDSFRVYEALECGCIPIVERTPIDYFTQFFGAHPFLSVSSWEEAAPLIEALLSDPERLEKKRVECSQWWLSYKEKMKKEMTSAILKALK